MNQKDFLLKHLNVFLNELVKKISKSNKEDLNNLSLQYFGQNINFFLETDLNDVVNKYDIDELKAIEQMMIKYLSLISLSSERKKIIPKYIDLAKHLQLKTKEFDFNLFNSIKFLENEI